MNVIRAIIGFALVMVFGALSVSATEPQGMLDNGGVTVALLQDTFIYNGAVQIPAFTVDGNSVYGSDTVASQDAGTYELHVFGQRDTDPGVYFSFRLPYTIEPKRLQITLPSDVVLPFTGLAQEYPVDSIIVDGLIPGEPEPEMRWGGRISGRDVDSYGISVEVEPNKNYSGSAATIWRIIPSASVVSIRDTALVYNGRPQAPKVELRTSPNSFLTHYYDADGTPRQTAPKDVGTYTVSLTCAEFGIDVRDSFVIAPLEVEIVFPQELRPYDGEYHLYDTSRVSVSQLCAGDSMPAMEFCTRRAKEVGIYPISATIEPLGNYTGAGQSPDALVILPSTQSIVITDTVYRYDAERHAPTVEFVSGDSSMCTVTWWDVDSNILVDSPKDAGGYTVTVHDSVYGVTIADSFVILPAVAWVYADSQRIYLDEPVPEFTWRHSPLCGTDTVVGALTVDTFSEPGRYPILQGTLVLDTNYILHFVSAELIVLAVPPVYRPVNFARAFELSYSAFGAAPEGKKKPKVRGSYFDRMKGRDISFAVATKANGSVLALQLKRKIRLFDPREYKKAKKRSPGAFTSELFDSILQDSPLTVALSLTNLASSVVDVHLFPPAITDTPKLSWNGKYLNISGLYFGAKPKVWLEYRVSGKPKIIRRTLVVKQNIINPDGTATLYLKWPVNTVFFAPVELVIDNQYGLTTCRLMAE